NKTVVGRDVPIRTGTNFLNGYSGTQTGTSGNPNYGVDNIQYKDVGLVIDVTPTVSNEGYVQVKMKLESSNVEASGSDSTLTPTFTKRSLTTVSRVQDGITAVVACVKQDNKGDSRATIPFVGMIPILGRLFTAPSQSSNQSDIVITVTPHIIRPAEIKPEDYLAHFSGTLSSGISQRIDDVLFRAQAEEEQERRAIAQQSLTPRTLAPQTLTPPVGSVINVSAQSRENAAPASSTNTPDVNSNLIGNDPESTAAEAVPDTPQQRPVPRAEVVPARRPTENRTPVKKEKTPNQSASTPN